MPNASRPASQHDSPADAHPYFQSTPDTVAEQSNLARQHGNRRKKGSSRDTNILLDPDEASAEEITLRPSPPTRGSSIIGQIPYSFPRSKRNASAPLLDALGATEKVLDGDVSDRHDEWAPSAPYGKSPPTGLVKDMGINNESTADQQIRGGFNKKSPPVSPPQRKARPVSYGTNARSVSVRKSSVDTGHRYSASAYGSSPPLPHLPQPHFYRVPDIDLGLGSRFCEPSVGRAASFIGFGNLPSAANASTSRTQVMLLGSESRLDILAINKKSTSPIGSLEPLAGQVIDAAFLTWESGNDPFRQLRPLVVVTIHGPKVNDDSTVVDQEDSDALEHSDVLPAIQTPPVPANDFQEEFQTRVDVYSLPERTRVATLFKTQPVPMQPSIRGYPRSMPPPIGDLRLDVGGNFVTVSSGTSGEVWAFGVQSSKFQCLGKFWTTIQANEIRRSSSSGGYLDRDVSPADLEASYRPSGHPILALGSRWLAICPAGPVSRPTLAGSIPRALAAGKVPGLDSHTAPPRPSETCILDSPDAPSLLNRVARGVAQEVVKGARWLGDQGLQTWNNYWRKDQHPQSPQTSPSNQPTFAPDQHPNFFPPTHAQETRSASEPELVSIIDLKRLQDGPGKKGADPLTPLATFQPPGGCSFVSFGPSGLNLLTASRKGDVQYVWDLMQIKHCRAAAFITTQSDASTSVPPEVSPRVRQVAKFPRLTSSSVVDVVWSPPVGDRLAVITRNGTVHVFDLPLSAFQWPPLRRGPRAGPVSAPASPAVHPEHEEAGAAGGVLASAMRLASKTQPILANLRGRAPSVGGGVSGISTNSIGFASVAGVRSGKAVAAGLSQSLEAAAGTVNTIRHAGDNRVHLSNMAKDPARARVVWGESSVLVVDGMVIRMYRVRRAQAAGKGRQKVSVVDANSAMSVKLPKLDELASINAGKQKGQVESSEERLDGTIFGYWTLRSPPAPKLSLEDSHPLSRAEIDTNAPYQPFHSDPRVNLFVHSTDITLSESQMPTASVIFRGVDTLITPDKWVFGNELPATKLNLRSSTYETFEEGGEDDLAAQIYRQTTTEGDGENEQIVSTTRPRKGRRGNASASMLGNGGLEETEELDFEDDVEFLDYATDRV